LPSGTDRFPSLSETQKAGIVLALPWDVGVRRKDEILPDFGPFRAVQTLGQGGMADVFRAITLTRAERPVEVVVKLLRPELATDQRILAMFRFEAQVAARFDHPNLVRVVRHGWSPAGYIQVMPYIDGMNVSELIDARGRGLPWEAAVWVAREVARGLAWAHALPAEDGQPMTLLHRDVSPSNVMLTRAGRVRLLDFGVAKPLTGRGGSVTNAGTRSGELKGKLGYMAPEQLDGKDLDQRADQFSLGVLLHEMCTGRRLFRDRASLRELRLARRRPVTPPSRVLGTAIPHKLDTMVSRLMAPDPARRFPGCQTVVGELERLLPEGFRGTEYLSAQVRGIVRKHSDSDAVTHPIEVSLS
jgi:serine/threonine protein kinase